MGKSNFQKFLKSYDRYAKNVSLSYKRSGSFETSIGGICSIFTFTILTYWLATNLWDNFAPPGKFSTKSSVALVEKENGIYDEEVVPIEDLYISYIIDSEEVADTENIEDYVLGLWFQQNDD